MFILLNPSAGGERARARWASLRVPLRTHYGPFHVHALQQDEPVASVVQMAIRRGHSFFVAAGGDGTVQRLADALMVLPEPTRSGLCLGALGLGSSNDFHKPVRPAQRIAGIPCKVDRTRASRRDVGVLTYQTPSGTVATRHWLLNASVGITAEANATFNAPGAVLQTLKAWSTAAAIVYAALHTILRYRPRRLLLRDGDRQACPAPVTNLAVLKSPFCSGSFRYGVPLALRGGTAHVHLCAGMSLPRTLLTLMHLAGGHSHGLPGTTAWTTERLQVEADDPFAVEFDGEVIRTRRALFSIRPLALEVCP